MPLPPLTHHDILALVGPFTRRGWRVDMAASDRVQRRLLFRPVEPESAPGAPLPAQAPVQASAEKSVEERGEEPVEEPAQTLVLDAAVSGVFTLTRQVALHGEQNGGLSGGHSSGLRAELRASGPQTEAMLARIESVAPARHFVSGAGFDLAYSFKLADAPQAADTTGRPFAGVVREPVPDELSRATLTHAATRVDGLSLTLAMPGVAGYPADITLWATAGDMAELPPDLLAVLGWRWRRLERRAEGWTSTLRLRGKGAALSRRVQAQWLLAAQHLARTLAEPPSRFHDRLGGARWRVAFQQSLPLLVGLGGIAGSMAMPRWALENNSALRMLVFNSPPLLLGLGFCLKELPRFELPRPPKRLTAASWRQAPVSPQK